MYTATVKNNITQCLEAVRSHPEHHLKVMYRCNLLKSFGASRIDLPVHSDERDSAANVLSKRTVADFAIDWLAILTGRHILPIWNVANNSVEDIDTNPQILLEHGVDIINGRSEISDIVRRLSNEYNIPPVAWSNYNDSSAYYACYLVLESIVSDNIKYLKSANENVDESRMSILGDFAYIAMETCSAINGLEVEPYSPDVIFNPQKRLEFWEWWLTEAIPQAWELAQQSTK